MPPGRRVTLVHALSVSDNVRNLREFMSFLGIILEDLASFVQVVDSGGFTAAGRVRGRSTKQVSREVARLEAQLGVQVVSRSTRAVALTEAGRRFYPHAVRILAEADDARAQLQGDDSLVGELRVCLPTLAPIAGLGAALCALREHHPGVSVRVALSDRPRDLIADGFDLQVTPVMPTRATAMVRRLLTVRMPLAAHRAYLAAHGHPQHPRELSSHACLRFVSDLAQDHWTLVGPAGEAAVVAVDGPLESDSSEVLFDALCAGLGIGVCGVAFLEGLGADQGLVRVLDGWFFEALPLYAVSHRADRKSRLVEAFLEHFTARLRAWV